MSTATVTDVREIPTIGHKEAMELAQTEFRRVLDLLRGLSTKEWTYQTSCPSWDVRAMVAHMLGMAEAQASFRQFFHDFRAAQQRTSGSMIDAMTATQVNERAELKPIELITHFAAVVPKAVRARRRIPAFVRWGVRMKQDPPFDAHRWQFGYLVDTIFTRDAWMHRLDICRATHREMVLTPEHDGRLVADVVREWAQVHGQPFVLELTGPAGGQWESGRNRCQERQTLDALEFCWILGGRAVGDGLLATRVPF
jgi:uncharacterized protein (TIGR03083 family)